MRGSSHLWDPSSCSYHGSTFVSDGQVEQRRRNLLGASVLAFARGESRGEGMAAER